MEFVEPFSVEPLLQNRFILILGSAKSTLNGLRIGHKLFDESTESFRSEPEGVARL